MADQRPSKARKTTSSPVAATAAAPPRALDELASDVILRMLWGNKKPRDCKKGDTRYKWYRHFFDKIYVFSPTWSIEPKMQRCKIPDDQIFDDPAEYEEVLQEIVEGQEEDIREDGKEGADHVLLIFSDLAGTRLFKNNRGILNRIAFNHRHFKISS